MKLKQNLLLLALLAAFGAQAQQTTTSDSGSQSGANASAGNGAVAVGNSNASRSDSASQSGASSGSLSGAVGNTVIFNPSSAGATAQGAGGIPTTRVINQQDGTLATTTTSTSTSRAEQILSGSTTANENVRYSGTVDNHTSGGTYDYARTDVNYSGTQTIKNVPSIAMSGPASGPCTGVSGGLSAAGPGFGIGLNGSAVMVDCRLRENSRVLGMAYQSLDGAANPQEKGEILVIFMDSIRALGGYNDKLVSDEKIVVRGKAK